MIGKTYQVRFLLYYNINLYFFFFSLLTSLAHFKSLIRFELNRCDMILGSWILWPPISLRMFPLVGRYWWSYNGMWRKEILVCLKPVAFETVVFAGTNSFLVKWCRKGTCVKTCRLRKQSSVRKKQVQTNVVFPFGW